MNSNLSVIDWAILAVAVIVLRLVSLSTRKYMKGVADFLSANRMAGRYLLTVSGQMASTGAISIVAAFEMYYVAGFTAAWWQFMRLPVTALVIITGWILYRYRETRAMTLAQFFEKRYSKRFRIFAGFVCWTCGILNFGIFPAVAARFFVYFCGLPDHLMFLGVSMSTFAVVMAIDLLLALTFVTMGGQVSVMVTECLQGMVSGAAFLVICGAVMLKLQWPRLMEALHSAPANASMLHPIHTGDVPDFNVFFYLIALFGAFYNYMSWQGSQGFYSSARSPHEAKMGGIIGMWRDIPLFLMILLLGVAGYAVMHLPEYSAQAASVNQALSHVDNENIRIQMRVPVALAHFLPVGIKGLFAMVMLFFSFTCHDTYMHSWGSIFVQDVYRPIADSVKDRRHGVSRLLSRIFRNPETPAQHITLLRRSIIGVATFAFVFSLLYQPGEKIIMFMAITGLIWLGGSGIAIIGGLYWRRGTTAGAYSALILGAVLGVSGLIFPKIYSAHFGTPFPINNQWLSFLGMLSSIVTYVIVSLIVTRNGRRIDLDKILHRGEYALRVNGDGAQARRLSKWQEITGITDEFSFTDKLCALSVVVWNFGWLAFFIVAMILNLATDISTTWWTRFWHVYVWIYIAIGIPTTIWFTIGGVIDIRALFRSLSTAVRDHTDDGRVKYESEPVTEPVGGPLPEPAETAAHVERYNEKLER